MSAAGMTLHELAAGMLPIWGDGEQVPAAIEDEVTIEAAVFQQVHAHALTKFFQKALARGVTQRFENPETTLYAWHAVFVSHPDG
jgi:hypothetical protein